MVGRYEQARLGQPGVLTPAATRRRVASSTIASPPPSSAEAPATVAPTLAWTTAAGALLGVVAAVADGLGGLLSDLLSAPGPWIAGAVLVAVAAARARRPWAAPAATAGFLLAGIAAYYLTKQVTTGAAPGPLVAFWGILAVGVGVGLGAITAWCMARPWGVAAVTGAVAGWLVVEALLLPAAPRGEALAGILCAGFVGRGGGPHGRRWGAAAAGAAVGALAAACVFAVLSRALTTML